MLENNQYPGQLVFGLDIGTRSIVGTVGYKHNDIFYVVAQVVKEHETRAMLDGQIHDIQKVGNTITQVKEALEIKIKRSLTEVCIAAAGRVLQTVTTSAKMEFSEDKVITAEDIFALDSAGVEKAYEEFQKSNQSEEKFYCVGYSVIHYYMNGYLIGNLENHKAHEISEELIATFLPDDVVDGLYRAVELAGLAVANLTLEPIAAIQVAIPENYRMLNIALVDVGAGTSDISITREGSIVAYGMLPIAGDSLTEVIARECLCDFAMAEKIKRGIMDKDVVEYEDIMLLPQQITKEEVLKMADASIEIMTKQVAEKIRELNGGKPVSAVFVVGGGGKIATYTDRLAGELGIAAQRVAIRGKEVMQSVEFLEEGIEKDSLLVTPIGICMNFYEQSNNFIYVTFNGERVKLYDNNKLAIVDAAMQADFPKEALFPRRGKELNFTVNGKNRIVRGQLGEPAEITLNGAKADLYQMIHGNDVIEVKEASFGTPASMEIQRLPEYSAVLEVKVNGKKVALPKFVSVNGELKSGFYEIQENDRIELLSYYTVEQIISFMDILLNPDYYIYVNNEKADMDTRVYENFTVVWTLEERTVIQDEKKNVFPDSYEELSDTPSEEFQRKPSFSEEEKTDSMEEIQSRIPVPLSVVVNGETIHMSGKNRYVFVDIFEYIDFDLTEVKGSAIVARKNGRVSQYMEPLHEGDVIEVYWKCKKDF